MVIIHEIIYFLLYHSILASIVGTLETPDDLFNDSADKIFPEQLQSITNVTYVKIWFDQIDVGSSNKTAVVREVSAPGIKYYIGLYFIIETPLNSSRVIDFLHPYMRLMNRFLSKFKTLTFIAGVAHVPPLPPYLYDISETNFIAGINPKLEDILKNHIFHAVITVLIFINKPDTLRSVGTDICTGTISYWDFDLNPAENQLDNFLEILILLGACRQPCGCDLLFSPSANISKEQIQCMTNSIQAYEVSCTIEPPKDVFVPVCGNGIIENTESCDCLNPLECGSKCDTNCNLRKSSRRGASQYFIISISSVIVILIILALSTFIYLHFKQGNSVKSQSSVISIPHVGSKTEFNIPVQCKLKDWTLTCTVGDVTMYNPSKSKFDLGLWNWITRETSQALIQCQSDTFLYMVIIYEIIYFLLYHSILASIVDTLETPDDLFNDVANKILPEQQQSMSINETYVKIWFDQIDVGAPITTAVVREVSAPGISYFFGLYFIIDTSLNSSRAINFLHPHVRIMNRFLSKIKTLSYIAGMAYVPPLPSNWSQVSEGNFRAGIGDKLNDILKSLIFDAIIVVFVFNNKRDSLVPILSDICSVPIVYWDYDLKPDNNGKDLNDVLLHEIVQLLEGCYGPCGADACLVLEENPVKNLSQEQIQCMVASLQLNEPVCIKKPPEDVFVPVCGNGIIENTESCDCLNPLECGSKCDANCNLRQKARGRTNRFFILTVSAVIIVSIVFALSLILFFYFKRRNNLESRNSGIAIPHGGSKTELNIPNQAKLKDWALTCTIAETTLRDPSKSKLELGIKEIVSSDSSKSKINAVSKESFTAKNIISVDRLQSTTDAMSFERLASIKIASKDRSQSKISVTSKERLKPRSITSKERTKSKTNASSKESLISKKISSTKVAKSKLPVDLAKSIQPKKTSSSKSVGKASLINPKTVSSKSLPKSKAQKDDLERNSFK